MKKFLAIMGSTSLLVVTTATVVSCGEARVNSIKVSIGNDANSVDGKYTIDGLQYSLTDLANALTTPTNTGHYPLYGIDLDQLVNSNGINRSLTGDVINLISSSSKKIIKRNNDYAQLRNTRNIFAGREEYKYDSNGPENTRFIRPSRDGLIMNWEDKDAYYKSYQSTSINSIEGLYKLANYNGSEISPALKESKDLADKVFAKDSDGEKFAKIFTGEEYNPYGEASFTSLKFNPSKAASAMFKYYETQTTIFDAKEPGITNESTNAKVVNYGTYNKINEFSDKQKEQIEEESKKLIGSRPVGDPDGRLVLGETPKAATTIKLVKELSEEESKTQKISPLIQLKDSNTIYLKNTTSKDAKVPSYSLIPQALYQKVEPIEFEFNFETDYKHRESENKGPAYNIKFKLSNLTAVWVPSLPFSTNTLRNPSDKDDKDKLIQITWILAGYKFSNGVDASLQEKTVVNEDEYKLLEFEKKHRFQDLNMTDLEIKEVK